jgi:predicted nucleic acid-binding protein
MSINSDLLLDACCLLNIYASGCVEAISEAMGCSFVIAEAVSKEALYVRRGGGGADASDREAVDLTALLTNKVLSIVTLDAAELATFLSFASQVDDGEAATCAIAVHRGLALATDDRKARRLLQAHAAHLRLYSTLDLLKHWADHHQTEATVLARTLIMVRDRGNFLPPRSDPLRPWWHTHIVPPPAAP